MGATPAASPRASVKVPPRNVEKSYAESSIARSPDDTSYRCPAARISADGPSLLSFSAGRFARPPGSGRGRLGAPGPNDDPPVDARALHGPTGPDQPPPRTWTHRTPAPPPPDWRPRAPPRTEESIPAASDDSTRRSAPPTRCRSRAVEDMRTHRKQVPPDRRPNQATIPH